MQAFEGWGRGGFGRRIREESSFPSLLARPSRSRAPKFPSLLVPLQAPTTRARDLPAIYKTSIKSCSVETSMTRNNLKKTAWVKHFLMEIFFWRSRFHLSSTTLWCWLLALQATTVTCVFAIHEKHEKKCTARLYSTSLSKPEWENDTVVCVDTKGLTWTTMYNTSVHLILYS